MTIKKHDPESYQIEITQESCEGELLWVARVAELLDLTEFDDSYEEAYSKVLAAIRVSQEACLEAGTKFPAPLSLGRGT